MLAGNDNIAGDERFCVDADRVVHETLDQETILIDLVTGTYYSLEGSGSEIWELLSAGVSVADAQAALSRRYPGTAESAARGVGELARELQEEGLLVPGLTGEAEPPLDHPAAQAFAPPVLRRYTDMEYFLRLDPVHEVDEAAGWPEPASSSAGR
jgi:hypothetical protein